MKKMFIILLLIAFSLKSYAQCTINSSSSANLTVGSTITYSVPLGTAQCSECYDWDINGTDATTSGNVQIVGSDQNNVVSIKILNTGTFSLRVNYINETGCGSCSLSVTVPAPITKLPNISCFGYDPVLPLNETADGTLNYAYVGMPYSTPIPDLGLTFTWYFRFADGVLLTLYGQNPTFREKCPTNAVVAFGLVVSNGVSSSSYYCGPVDPSMIATHGIPNLSVLHTIKTCFLHQRCDETVNYGKISPKEQNSDTNTIVKFDNENLISVFPNPTHSKIFVSLSNPNGSNVSVIVSDNFGRTVLRANSQNTDGISLDLTKLPAGTYLVSVNLNEVTKSFKVIKVD